ncbi:relaxase/mobilization nuclease domain-containing protein (plasmid) [Finegoldia magna]|uniref:relaxase/mobilization nuclease domain-containing protein n=1 Tax=Finegoldia magna TaxID=1260 RepID=UPI00370D9692
MAYLKVRAIKNISDSIDYIEKDEQTYYGMLVREINGGRCEVENKISSPIIAYDSFSKYGIDYENKVKNEGLSIILSFDPQDKVTVTEALDITKKLMEEEFPNQPVVLASHVNGRNIHTHSIVSSYHNDSINKYEKLYSIQSKLRKKLSDVCIEKGLSNMYELIWNEINQRVYQPSERLERKNKEIDINFKYRDKKKFSKREILEFKVRSIIYEKAYSASNAIELFKEKGLSVKEEKGIIYIKNQEKDRYRKLSKVIVDVNTREDLDREIKSLYTDVKQNEKNIKDVLRSSDVEALKDLRKNVLAIHEKYFYMKNVFASLKVERKDSESFDDFRRRYKDEEKNFITTTSAFEMKILSDLDEDDEFLKKLLFSNTTKVKEMFNILIEKASNREFIEDKEIKLENNFNGMEEKEVGRELY